MKKILLVVLMLVAQLLFGCAKTPEEKNYSTEPNEKYAITYLLSNFEVQTNQNAETACSKIEICNSDLREDLGELKAMGGYFYTYDDPAQTIDTITPGSADMPECNFCEAGAEYNSEKGEGNCCDEAREIELTNCEEGTWLTIPDDCNISQGIQKQENPAISSNYAMHLSGTTSGEGVGFGIYFSDDDDFTSEGGKFTRPLGDTGAEGVTFWAKGNADIEVALPMPEGTPFEDGGICDLEAGEKCYDPHRVRFELDGAWRQYWAEWSEFQQEGWGIPVDFDPNEFLQVQIKVIPPEKGTEDFDLWIDTLGFYGGDSWKFTEWMLDTDLPVGD